MDFDDFHQKSLSNNLNAVIAGAQVSIVYKMTKPSGALERNDHEPEEKRGQFLVVLWLLLAFGVTVRIFQYLHYRALFYDEAVLASNVLDRTVGDLFLPYANSMAPGAYMVLTKAIFGLGGTNEYAARFVPFLGGLLLLLAFYPVARRLTTPASAIIALGFLAVSKYLIEFSDFVRPYSTDAFVAIGLIGLAMYVDAGKPSWLRYTVFGFLGACSLWFSYPATFVLAGIGFVQFVFPVFERDWRRLRYLAPVWSLWLVSFLVFYVLSLRPIRGDEDTMFLMNDYYQYANAFMPFPPTSFHDLKWFNYHSIKIFEHPAGLTLPGLGAFASLLGCVSLFVRNKKHLAYLIAPIGMALMASGLERYPFWARTILWIAPILYLLIGEGIASLWLTRKRSNSIVAALLLAMLLFVPGVRALRMIPNPSTHHELNKALDYVVENWEPGDLLYVRLNDADAFRFCRWRYDFSPEDLLIETGSLGEDREEAVFVAQSLPRFRESGRVWFAIAYDLPGAAQQFLALFEGHATRIEEQHMAGASAYLFDFR